MNKIFSILLIRNEARLISAPDWETAIRAASIVYGDAILSAHLVGTLDLDADDLTDEKETLQ
ncbi:MAG: hypothetical protein M0T84_01540 [Betaproteobacteria bacterium]|nr:hypothetical protein [Betaproteobacteria bacterium]